VQVLAHRRVDDADEPQRGPASREDPGPVPGESIDLADDVARGTGRGDREVPHAPGGARRRPQGDERGRDIGGVGVAVLQVRVTHNLGGPAAHGGAEHGSAERGLGDAGPEEVRGTADGYLDPAGLVRGQQLGGHRRPGGRLGRCRVGGQGFDQVAAAGGAVGVEIVQDDEARARGFGGGEDSVLQRREIPGPVVVARGVEAEINRVRAGADPRRERRIGGVAGDYLRAVDGAEAGTVHRGHVGAQADEPLGYQAADLSGAEDDVTATHDCSPPWR
jgi:hypothetical protein